MSIVVYGIPTCDTCKKAQKWFTARNIEYTWIDMRKAPPTTAMIQQWVAVLGNKVMRNTSGKSYRALDSNKTDWSDAQWVEAFTKDPMLLKRPLIVQNDIAVMTGFRGSDADLEQIFM